MALLPHESLRLSSSAVYRQLLVSSGNSTGPLSDEAKLTTGEIIEAALGLYEAGITDPVTQPAAYGMAVAIVSTNLEVSIRAAALIFSTVLDVRGHK